jgi:predicted dehydrogenase
MGAIVRLGVVGLGRMGRMHARYLAAGVPGARLVGIAEVDEGRRSAEAAELGVEIAVETAGELAARPDVDAILVATPSVRHPDDVAAVAAEGKDLLCEKPLALTEEGSAAAMAAVRAAGVRLQVGLMRRHDPDYRRAVDVIRAGDCGRPVMFRSLQFDPESPPAAFCDPAVSGGIFLDMGIHEFDLARWMLDDEVVEVTAYGSSVGVPELAAVGDFDSAVAVLRFAGGATGAVELARTAVYGEDVRTEVLGSTGSLFVGRLPLAQGAFAGPGFVTTYGVDPSTLRFQVAYAAQVAAFVTAIAGDRPVTPDGEAATAALRIALAARRSVEEGRPVAVAAGGVRQV